MTAAICVPVVLEYVVHVSEFYRCSMGGVVLWEVLPVEEMASREKGDWEVAVSNLDHWMIHSFVQATALCMSSFSLNLDREGLADHL